ncbi:MAG TPA: DUF1573 domain-containing protein [Fimbriimonadales bacterium]|nr:DUF1573 domain-containing protein [Fimbriimonadales bacterium]
MIIFTLAGLFVLQTLGPTLPPYCTQELYDTNYEIQLFLSSSQFEKAVQRLESWLGGEIGYQIVGSKENLEDVFTEASRLWESASENRVKFVKNNQPRIRFLITDNTPDEMPLPKWENGVLVAKIPLTYGEEKTPFLKNSLIFAAAKAFGVALGLAPRNVVGTLMGKELRMGQDPPRISPKEQEILNRILSARERLANAIQKKIPLVAAVPKITVESTKLDKGQVQQGANVSFPFRITNTGNALLEITPETTCLCVNIPKQLTIAQGETKTFEPVLVTNNLLGSVNKTIVLHTNDVFNPTITLYLITSVVPEYRILPDTIIPVGLEEDKETVAEFYVYIPPGNPVRLLSVTPNNPKVKTEILPFHGELFDPYFDEKPVKRVGYVVKVTFPKDFMQGLQHVYLDVLTDAKKRPATRVVMQAVKGIVIMPNRIMFSSVPSTGGATRSVTVKYLKKPFKILEASVDRPEFEVSFQPLDKSNHSYKVTVTYKGGQPGELEGTVTLKTNIPEYSELTFPIGGTSR